ncbi:hypothetical protein MLD38_008332 [Melastoma candidum]|uniref:Uncharacterized protein n=1 Tax=Melastoma candidum TaxID=119954 RepID=A0ACB9RU56_9MYRT|nr:hypothetical protein MLD38_008332 [Melastoma candidum]
MGFKGIASVFFNKHSSTSPSPVVRSNLNGSLAEETIVRAESVILRWGSEQSDSDYLFSPGHREGALLYMESVRRLQDSMHLLVKEDPHSELLVRAQSLMEASMKRLTKEFHRLLSTNLRFGVEAGEPVSCMSSGSSTPARLRFSYHSEDESDFDRSEFDRSEFDCRDEQGFEGHGHQGSTSDLSDLRTIADCMIALGYAKECISTYKIVRRSIVQEELHNYGWEKPVISPQQIQKMDWDVLEDKIKRWLVAVKVAVKTVFPREKALCDGVFSASKSLSQSCFADITRDIATALFEFAGAVGKRKRSPEKIFRMLDMYEAIARLWLQIETTFSSDSTSVVRSRAVDCLIKLAETVRSMLRDYEMAIQKDYSKSAVPGGGVHPLTRYVMNYLVFLGDYGELLEDIVADWPLELHGSLPEPLSCLISDEFEDGRAPSISMRFAWLILVLLCKLDAKAEAFKDVALSYLFLANNLRYIVAKVTKSGLRHVLGDDWIIKHDSKVREYASKYERIGWAKVLSSLPDEKSTATAEIGPEEAKAFIGGFNVAFEEAFARQASWVAPDPKLREEIRGSLAGKLLPAYRRVYGAFGKEKPRQPIIKFSPEDLENYMSELLYVSGGGSRDNTLSYSDSTTGSSRSSRSSGSSTGSFPAHFLFGLGR